MGPAGADVTWSGPRFDFLREGFSADAGPYSLCGRLVGSVDSGTTCHRNRVELEVVAGGAAVFCRARRIWVRTGSRGVTWWRRLGDTWLSPGRFGVGGKHVTGTGRSPEGKLKTWASASAHDLLPRCIIRPTFKFLECKYSGLGH